MYIRKLKSLNLLFLITFFFLPVYSNAAEQQKEITTDKAEFIIEHGDLPILTIVFSGIRKTKRQTLRECLTVTAGEPLSSFNNEKITQNIYRLGFIQDITINYEEVKTDDNDKVLIDIKLKEKHTFVPIPILTKNDDGYMLGLLGLESNLFGLNKMLVFGFFYLNTGWNSIIILEDPGTGENDFIFKFSTLFGNMVIQNTNIDGDKYQEYKNVFVNSSLQLGYHIKNTDIYALGGFKKYSINESYKDNLFEPQSSTYLVTGADIKYSDVKYSSIKMTGLQIKAVYQHSYNTKDTNKERNFDDVNIRGSYSFNAISNNILSVNAAVGYGNNPDLLKHRLSGKTCFRSLPSNKIASDKYSGADINYEVPLYSNNDIAVSALAFAESGILEDLDSMRDGYFGTGGGLMLYLKGVALPAVNIQGAYNFESEEFVYSGSVGHRI